MNEGKLNIDKILSNELIDEEEDLLKYFLKEESSILEFKGSIYCDIKKLLYSNEKVVSWENISQKPQQPRNMARIY